MELHSPRLLAAWLILLCSLGPSSGGGGARSEAQRRCEAGLVLHGQGRWEQALSEFAGAVVEFGVGETMDCVYGAGLSLNTLGDTEGSLSAFRLAQRLQAIHPLGSAGLAEASMRRCHEAAAAQSSSPFLSCSTFRTAADLLHDALDGTVCRFEPSLVFPGAVVYVNTLLLTDFMVNKHPYIKSPYVLVTHCSDASAPGEFDYILDDPKLIGWYAQNADLTHHPKLHPIPIGIANMAFAHGDVAAVERAMRGGRGAEGRDGWLYVNFDDRTSGERAKASAALRGKDFVTAGERGPFEAYLGELRRHRFVLCPQGNGLDTHRTWEALLMGAVPVTARSTLDGLYDGLPVVLVDDWDEISRELLEGAWAAYLREFPGGLRPEAVMAAEWLGRIRGHGREASGGGGRGPGEDR